MCSMHWLGPGNLFAANAVTDFGLHIFTTVHFLVCMVFMVGLETDHWDKFQGEHCKPKQLVTVWNFISVFSSCVNGSIVGANLQCI